MTRAILVPALILVLLPEVAAACAACLAAAYGDRTYNWAFLGLLLMPFLVAAVIGGLLLSRYGGGLQRFFRSSRLPHRSGPSPLANSRVEETT
jgi:hypothetical protein